MKKNLYVFVCFFYWMEYILLKFIPSKRGNSILIMRLDAIGDAIIWLDAAKEFKKHFADKHVVLLCNEVWKEIANELPYFDEIIPINRSKFFKNIGYRFKILKSLKKRNFEQIINTMYSRDYFVTDSLIRNISSNNKIGSLGNYENTENSLRRFSSNYKQISLKLKKKADKFYTKLVEATTEPLMELSRNAEFIRNYLDPSFQSQLPIVPFQIPVSNQVPKQDYIVIFIGAATLRRVWNIANYAEVIKEINPNYEIVLCGGKEDEPLYEEFKKINTHNRIVTNLIGKTTLLELFSIIKYAKFIITNETSASHITVAVKTPSVCILAGAHYERFQPYIVENITDEEKKYLPKIANYFMDCYYCNHVCKYISDKKTTYPCVAKISPQTVIEKIKEIEVENNFFQKKIVPLQN